MDRYIAGLPADVQQHLKAIRQTIAKAIPGATEAIKYGMPTFIWYGNVMHYAAHLHHVGMYPAPTGISSFKRALAGYKTGKGSVQFPFEQPMPLALIARIAKYRARQNAGKARARGVVVSAVRARRSPARSRPKNAR